MSGRTWRIVAAAVGFAGIVATSVYIALTLMAPPRLGLPSGSLGTPGVTPSSDPMAAVCRRPALPAATTATEGSSLWLIQPGSVVGYRVREKFVQLPSPHEAVARTGQVGGWVLASQSGTGIQIQTGCVAVDVATLKSVDSIPGYGTNGRDQIYGTLFETSMHPYAIFQPYPISLASLSDGQTVHVVLRGVLEMRGVAKPAEFSLAVKRSSGQVAVAGSAPVNADEYGLFVREGPEGFVSIDPHCTVELSLVLQKT